MQKYATLLIFVIFSIFSHYYCSGIPLFGFRHYFLNKEGRGEIYVKNVSKGEHLSTHAI